MHFFFIDIKLQLRIEVTLDDDDDDELFCGMVDRRKAFSLISSRLLFLIISNLFIVDNFR